MQSGLLETVLSKQYKGREELLLGEMQFAFIAFVVGLPSLHTFCPSQPVNQKVRSAFHVKRQSLRVCRFAYFEELHRGKIWSDVNVGDIKSG